MACIFRSVLEVLKYTDPSSILQHSSQVSQLWHSASDSEELWSLFLECYDFDPELRFQLGHSKARFQALLQSEMRSSILGVVKGKLILLSCRTGKMITSFGKQKTIIPEQGTAAVLIAPSELLLCGGDNLGKRAIVHYSDGRAPLLLPELVNSRSRSSVLFYRRTVFVFGGTHYSDTAEKLFLEDKAWTRLARMLNPHCATNAVRQRANIYLCGGDTTACEVYSVERDSFSLLPVKLNQVAPTVVLMAAGRLVVLCARSKYVISVEGDLQSAEVEFVAA